MIQGHTFTTDLMMFSLGGSEMILGVDWLKQHNPVTFDFQKVNITINKNQQPVVLQGEVEEGSLKTISCKRLSKLLKGQNTISHGYLCLISAMAEESAADQGEIIDAQIQPLLDQYKDIFSEPTELPPNRNHVHRIPLLQGSQPVNQRGYRVPYGQRLEIEKQVKEMLENRVIQVSTSPFASPVILVKKKDNTWRMCVIIEG